MITLLIIDSLISGVGLINASPNAMGLLTHRGPPEWHPAALYTPTIATACKEASNYCAARNVDMSRLALHFSLELADCATCLVSTASMANAQKNLDVIANPLSEEEKKVLEDVIGKYMKPLENSHWEGFEREALYRGEFVG